MAYRHTLIGMSMTYPRDLKGRKRHLLADTLGLLIAWYVTSADLSGS